MSTLTDRLAIALRGLLNQAVVDAADPEDINPAAVKYAQRALEAYDRDPMPCILPFVVKELYQVELHPDSATSAEQELKWFAKAENASYAKRYKDLDIQLTNSGPAWDGYITITGPSKRDVIAFADRMAVAARVLKIKLER